MGSGSHIISSIYTFLGVGVFNKLEVKLGGSIDNWGEGVDLGNVKITKEIQ